MVGQAADWSGATPKSSATVSVSLVLLEQLQELQKYYPVPDIGTA